MNVEALAHWGLLHKKKGTYHKYKIYNMSTQTTIFILTKCRFILIKIVTFIYGLHVSVCT